MVLARFLPRDEQFFTFFQNAVENAVEAAGVLGEIVAQEGDVERAVRRLSDLEHRGDEITHRIFSALNSTFVTPIDRDDIQALAATVDDFLDGMEEAGKRLWLYRLTDSPEPARFLTRVLQEQAAQLVVAMPLLEAPGKNDQALRKHVLEVHRLENEGDDALNRALATLYDDASDIPTLIRCMRWGELYGLLEDATDRAEDIADVLEGVVLKNA
ncbi:MAG: DUF47 domain-containing protein [Thermomicrobiales bacterium]|nr:DUF47 domain-containing protein [Thermomicrobiales bacterium]